MNHLPWTMFLSNKETHQSSHSAQTYRCLPESTMTQETTPLSWAVSVLRSCSHHWCSLWELGTALSFWLRLCWLSLTPTSTGWAEILHFIWQTPLVLFQKTLLFCFMKLVLFSLFSLYSVILLFIRCHDNWHGTEFHSLYHHLPVFLLAVRVKEI